VSGLAGSGGGGMVTVGASDEMVRLLLERIAAEVKSRGGDAATIGIRIA
jgi:hypothetical protein